MNSLKMARALGRLTGNDVTQPYLHELQWLVKGLFTMAFLALAMFIISQWIVFLHCILPQWFKG